ncbi:MAG: hypothetical protein R3C03_14695 [Pirellulaceae bacterium]
MEELCELQKENEGRFIYIPTVTRESHPCALQGRLTTLLKEGKLEERTGCPICPKNTTVMLCGNPDMLNDMEGHLMEHGLLRHRTKSPGNIVVERYW